MRSTADGLRTARLQLRRFTPADQGLIERLTGDPQVMRYAGGVKTPEQAAEMLRVRILQYYEEHPGMGVWATEERESGAFVGLHLLNHLHGEPLIQVGYLLLPQHWGRGYATEMAAAVVRYGFKELGLAQIVAITHQDNAPSQRVLRKAGLRREGDKVLAHPAYADSNPLAWFEADAATWSDPG